MPSVSKIGSDQNCRQHDLRNRQDNINLKDSLTHNASEILRRQASTQVEISRQSSLINQLKQTSKRNHVKVLQHIRRNSDLNTNPLQHPDLEESLAAHENRLANQITAVHALQAQVMEEQSKSNQSLNEIRSSLFDVDSLTKIEASSVDLLTKTVRSEIRSELNSILQQMPKVSASQSEASMSCMEKFIDECSNDLGRQIFQGTGRDTSSKEDPRCEHQSNLLFSERIAKPDRERRTSHTKRTDPMPNGYYARNESLMSTKVSRSWFVRWRFGSIQIISVSEIQRKYGSPECDLSSSIYIHFRPSQAWMRLHGISAFYSTASNPQGYFQLFPMISTFPLMTYEDPVRRVIKKGSLVQFQEMLKSGQTFLRCQDIYGGSLLHVSQYSYPIRRIY